MDIINIIIYLFFISLAIQLAYWLSFLKLIFHKDPERNGVAPPVTIIICAWNEEENLRELIPLLFEQDHQDLEVVIVDDRSVDGTYDYLVSLRTEYKNLKVVRVDNVPDHLNAKKYALLLGIKAASNDHLLLTDADCRPVSSEWAQEVSLNHNEKTAFVIGFSPYSFEWTPLNLLVQYETLLTGIHYLSAALWGSPYMAVGRNLSYKKSFFMSHNGFLGIQHIVGGDDDLFVNKYASEKNTAICISPKAMVMSSPKEDWKSYIIQKKRHFSVGKHFKKRDKIRLSVLSISQILFWICFVTLAVLSSNPYLIAGGFGLRLFIQLIVVGFGAKKLSVRFPIVLLPIMDLIFTVFLPLVSVPALLSKKIKWS